ncbi:MAG TPA: endospore germination permease [Symbiobacteriaceae bacterium]|jgi:spore germination protein|nr:endospore germination permease [Symbiobacteriaceae bacterium]
MTHKHEEHGSVTPYQYVTVIVGAAIGAGVLIYPRLVIEQASTGGPIATLLGAIPAALCWICAIALDRKFHGRTPVEYAPQLLTRPVGWLYGLAVILLMLMLTALTAREFGAVLKTAILPNTPIEVTISVMLLTVAYFVRYDLQVFARVFEVFFPIIIVPLTIIALLSLKNARIYYLFPPLGLSWSGLFRGIAMASTGFTASLAALFLLPSLSRPKQALRSSMWGLGISTFLYVLVMTATLAVFGPEETKRLVWPTFELIKTTTVPGFILERMESAFVGIWVAAVFTTVGATYYVALLAITQLLRLGDHKVMAIPLVPILYMIAMAPADIHTLYRVTTAVGLAGIAFGVVSSLLMTALAYVRRKGAPTGATQAK